MGFTLPTFNLICNIWRNGNPVSNPPDVVSLCNLALGRRHGGWIANDLADNTFNGNMWLLLPPGTDIRDSSSAGGKDVVEVGSGTGRLYDCQYVDDAGGGFANEHRIAVLNKHGLWPDPIPRPGAIVPPIPPFTSIGVFGANAGSSSAVSSGFVVTRSAVWLMAVGVNSSGVTLTASSALAGAMSLVASQAVTLPSGLMATIALFYVPAVVGTDTFTVTCSAPAMVLCIATQDNANTIDVAGSSSGSGTPVVVSTGTATTFPNEKGLCFTAYANFTGVTGFPSPWTPGALNVQGFLDDLGNPWQMEYASRYFAAVGVESVTANIFQTSPSDNIAMIAAIR